GRSHHRRGRPGGDDPQTTLAGRRRLLRGGDHLPEADRGGRRGGTDDLLPLLGAGGRPHRAGAGGADRGAPPMSRCFAQVAEGDELPPFPVA
ncbi:hypothetical protein DF186_15770, partial [Enterococcus hirae]